MSTTYATVTSYMPGDILFYASLPNDVADTIITNWTGSSFVHVAIAVSAMLKVEALFQGVVKTPIDGRTIAGVYHYHEKARVDATDLASALLWLDGQVGQMYGYGDIINAILAKVEHGFSVNIGEHYDCSGLAAEFLIHAGGVPNIGAIQSTHEVTPAQLAALLGVVAGSR